MDKSKEILEKYAKVLKDINSDWDPKKDWFYEGNVSRVLVEYLKFQSYECEKDNSDNIHAHGADIIVSKNGIKEVIEVKGYPSDKYVKGNKQGQPKLSTPQSLQACHWFAGCLHSTLSNYGKHKGRGYKFQLAMCFPDYEKYRKEITKIRPFFSDSNLNIKIYLINKEGEVRVENLKTK